MKTEKGTHNFARKVTLMNCTYGAGSSAVLIISQIADVGNTWVSGWWLADSTRQSCKSAIDNMATNASRRAAAVGFRNLQSPQCGPELTANTTFALLFRVAVVADIKVVVYSLKDTYQDVEDTPDAFFRLLLRWPFVYRASLVL